MSLYVRLMTGFWSHRKTAKLRSLIGDDALWVPLRLWCYAAEHQPDGCFKQYSSTDIAMLIAYSKDATVMLEALHTAGFMDNMNLHGWEEHNGFHKTYSDRAQKAAKARWSTSPQTPLPEEESERDTDTEQALLKHASSMEGFLEFWKSYPNKTGKGDAEKVWKTHKLSKLSEDIMAGLKRSKASQKWIKDNGQYVPNPAKWLRSKGWEDGVPVSSIPRPKVEPVRVEDIGPMEGFEWMRDGKRPVTPDPNDW
jgi:hypothetical protein